MADYITTAETTLKNRDVIKKRKAEGNHDLISMVSMNIAFSASGLNKVRVFKASLTNTLTYTQFE